MTKIKLKITKDIIEQSIGCQGNPFNCLIARAIREIFPKAIVSKFIYPFGDECFFPNSSSAMMLILLFDTAKTVEQIRELEGREIELDIPDWALERATNGDLEKAKQIISQSKILKLV